MRSSERSLAPVALRRSLAVVECAVAGGLLLLAYELLASERVGGDGIATGWAWLFGALLELVSPGVALAAVTAWLGGRRWWVWQVAMVIWAWGMPAVSLLALIFFGSLFGEYL